MMIELPEVPKAQLDAIRSKLVKLIEAGATDHTTVRSEFMRYGISEGGQVLDAKPEIAHPYQELLDMYIAMFDAAKADGVELREIQTIFRRAPGGKWSYDTRWVTVPEYERFLEAVGPTVEEMRKTLRNLVESKVPEWEFISFSHGQQRVLIRRQDRQRITFEPTPELASLVQRISAIAQEQGLEFTGGTWDVESGMEDAEGEIDSAMGVI